MRNNQAPGGADWSDMTGDDLDELAADRLLDGVPSGPPALTRLLTAASAPGRASELAREESVLAAFRLVRDAAPPAAALRPVARHERRRVFPRRASVRLLVAGGALVAVAAAGGVAVAAGIVPGPGPLRILAPAIPAEKSDDRTPGRTAGGTGTPGQARTSENGAAGRTTTTSPVTTPANLNGLCRSFQEAAAEDLPAALANPHFAVLISLAGGADEVPAYCVKVIADKKDKPEASASPAP